MLIILKLIIQFGKIFMLDLYTSENFKLLFEEADCHCKISYHTFTDISMHHRIAKGWSKIFLNFNLR